MGIRTRAYKMRSITAMASRKPIQIQAAVRRIRIESLRAGMCKSYHEEHGADRVCRHDFPRLPMTPVMGGSEEMHVLWG